jgi:hypothetical protein
MTETCESSLRNNAFVPLLPPPARSVVVRPWESAPEKLTRKRSFAAAAFLAAYLAAYIGVGFAGVALLEIFWSAIFQ